MKEAFLYEQLDHHIVRCHVCHHLCLIQNNERGLCGVRENINGKLYALNYGKTISCGIDPIEKKPIYHYLSHTLAYSIATVGCNFNCRWCQNWQISQSPKTNKKILGNYISPKDHIQRALIESCSSIAYTYSEPTIFLEYAYDVMNLAHKNGLKNIWVSNGYMSNETLSLILPLVDAMNVDFKGFDEAKHIKYCGGSSKVVKDNLKTIYQYGVHLEITTLVVPGFNDDLEELEKIADFIINDLSLEVPWHITRFYPAWKMTDVLPTDVNLLYDAKSMGHKKGIKHIHIGNV
ncbi:AmmeMemoRadiSam system radical SAM enzyme [Mycoplasmatota bacterium]|nr:AmmeMemoRadiSam system radical SAM enzyme [Mycoplasmatota bacterium]